VALALVQGTGMTVGLANQGLTYDASLGFYVIAITSLVTGAVFMMWLGEQITEKGIGNGISLLIFAGIVAGLPQAIGQSLEQARQGELNILILLGVLALAIVVIALVVFIERGQRRITVNYAKRQQGRQMYQAPASHLPLKVNMAWRDSRYLSPAPFFCSQPRSRNGLAVLTALIGCRTLPWQSGQGSP
jgi:preprotein translocase subunit SecY